MKVFINLKKYISLYLQSFALFWKASKTSSLILLFLVPIQAIAPAALIKLAQMLLDELLNTEISSQLLLFWGITFFISSAAVPINTSLQGILTDQLIAFVNTQLMEKSKTIKGLNLFEDPDFYDNLQFINSQASWQPVNLIVFGISMIRELITVISMLFLLARYNFWIALILLVAIIPQSLVSYHIQQNSFETMVTRSPDARKVQYYSEALLTTENAKEVRLFGMFDYFIKSYRRVYKRMHAQMKNIRLHQMWISLAFLVFSVVLSIGSLLWMIRDIQQGHASAGVFLIFVSTLTSTADGVYAFIENSSLLYDTLLYMEKYFSFMNVKEENDFSGELPFPQKTQDIVFNNISFKYPGQQQKALANVSFKVSAGERIAIVGENGSGKSTLVKLLMRFYDPQEGEILINNTPISELDINQYRKKFGVVFQDYARFYLPIRDAVGLGNPAKRHDEGLIISAMQKGGFYDSYVEKNLTLDTMLGKQFNGGIDLSGGQWQKIAISRAFMPSSKILILDEPTASLDPRSEFEIYQSFIEMTKGKTVFFITHRLSAVKMANRVLVLKNGEIIGLGSHDELMQNNSYYSELYNLQAQSFQ
ncbi:multidrug ABC transporter ATP-binding and permease protein [Ligilactobacillus salitolerans]|uniref:Multidrug ABC transporter ATP-binding and permease protein n=1 Tax=Ligilactobacillus salitolerans TaxID=1808352 RepID=A0A401IQS5_9LACO|nr:ABC transporter ATP-binding protein [Ligilactobacillus salitolerans]GBG93899.1 multidrug ABC transporter ATP-binding and permease protein [Ligilactobacillus salitolerans]